MTFHNKTLLLFLLLNSYTAIATNNIVGLWLIEDNQTVVRIIECNTTLCGKIEGFNSTSKTEEGNHSTIEEEISQEYEQISKVCNTNIIGGFQKEGSSYNDGWIKDFEINKVYSADLKLINTNQMKVFAYLGIRMFGETLIWNKVDTIDLSCDEILEGN